MQFNLLGPLEVLDGDNRLALGGVNQRAALGLLLLNANQVVSTRKIMAALWGDCIPATSRKMVQNSISGLRRILEREADGSVALSTRSPGYLLQVDPSRVDLSRFRLSAEQGRAELLAGSWESAARTLGGALRLWRGSVLADLTETGIEWPELTAVQNTRLAVFEDRIQAELALGRHHELVGELEGTADAEPARERLCGQLMLALYRCGRQLDALTAYQRTRATLVEEFGLDPGRELQELEQAILRHDPGLDLPGAAARTGARPAPGATARHLSALQQPAAAQPQPGPGHQPARPRPRLVEAVAPLTAERVRASVMLVRVQLEAQPGEDDPEQVDAVLKAITAAIREEVEHFGGVVRVAMGSAWLVLFGVPRTREDDPERAVRAALAVQARLGSAGAGGAAPALPLTSRAAVATGAMTLTYQGEQEGHPVELTGAVLTDCEQLLSTVAAGRVRVCDATRAATSRVFDFDADESPSTAWRVCAVRAEGSRQPEPAIPVVGRERELHLLQGLLDDVALRGRPCVVTVLGEPGIGKSRLVGELRRRVAESGSGTRWMTGRTPPFGGGSAVDTLAGMVRSYAGIGDADTAAVAERKLADAVHGLVGRGERGQWMLAGLRPCLDRSGRASRREPLDAWQQFIEEAAAQRPLVAVVEDLHRADDTLVDFVSDLAEHAGPVPLLVIATARPELLQTRPAWGGGRRDATTVTLDPLSGDETEFLVTMLLARHGSAERGPVPAGPRAELVARAGGNPLFAEEFVRALGEGGRGRAPVRPAAAAGYGRAVDPLPQPVRSVVAARLATLPRPERAVLRDAAVMGDSVCAGALAVLGDRDQAELMRCLEALVRKEFIQRVRRSPGSQETEYSFRRGLVREVAYSQLPRQAQAEKHCRAAAWVGGLPPDRAGLLAHHYERALALTSAAGHPVASLRQRACRDLVEAGRRAALVGAHRVAVRCYQSALDFCPPEDQARRHLLASYRKSLQLSDGQVGDIVAERCYERPVG